MSRLELYSEPINLSSEEAFARLVGRPPLVFLDSATIGSTEESYSLLALAPLQTVTEFSEWQRIASRRQESLVHQSGDSEDWPFCGGWMGSLAYEFYAPLIPQVASRATDYPLLQFGFFDSFLIFAHRQRKAWIASLGLSQVDAVSDRQLALERIKGIQSKLEKRVRPEASPLRPQSEARPLSASPLRARISFEQYGEDLARIQQYIRAGDCYQVSYTQRFSGRTPLGAAELYQRLRRESPAPMAAYLDWGLSQILSASPETFFAIRGRTVSTYPIKGTRRRSANEEEDKRLRAELLDSTKDRAELLMITDLERNDLGRVCVPGTVTTKQLVALQTLEQVHHLYSVIEGKLKESTTPWDVLAACFPGGSITGAPKIRAMQIIRELEAHAREVYTGAIGYLSVNGACHFSIPIRTLLYRGGELTAYAGGGIVADSEAESEYEECFIKLKGIQKALG